MTERRAFLRDIKSAELVVDCLERALTVWQAGLMNATNELQSAYASARDDDKDTVGEYVMDAALQVNSIILDMQRAQRDLSERRAFRHIS